MARHRSGLSKLTWRSLLRWVGVLIVVGWGLSWFLNQTTPYLLALDAKTGHVQWTVLKNFIGNTAIANQQVLIQHFSKSSESGYYRWNLTALDTTSGEQRWTFQFDKNLTRDYAAQTYVSSNTLYVALGEGQLLAIDVNTGQLRWNATQFQGLEREPGIVASGDRAVFLGRTENGRPMLQAVKAATGELIWQAKLPFSQQQLEQNDFYLSTHSALRINDRTAFFLGLNDTVYAFDLVTGEQQTILTVSAPTDDTVIAKIEVFDQTLYALGYSTLTAHNLATSQEKWSYGDSRRTCKQEAIASNLQMLATVQSIYTTCIDFQGTWLLALASNSGQRQWLQRVSPSSHAVDYSPPQKLAANSDLVFVNTEAGYNFDFNQIIAFSTQDGKERWSVTLNDPAREHSLITDGDRVYIRDYAPRWRSWLMHYSPL